MEVKIAVLADAANVSQEGKLNIAGIFDRITTGNFPAQWPAMAFVVKLAAHSTESGKHEMKVVVADEDGRKIAEMGAKFTLDDGAAIAGMPLTGQVVFPIAGAQFPKPGIYSFDILIDGRYEDSAKLLLVKRGT